MVGKHRLQLFLLSAVWGVSFLMIRIAGTTFPPLWVALLRSGLGAALLWTILWRGGHRLPPRGVMPWLALVALLNNAVPFTFFAWGERSVPSNIAAVINATTPIWTLLLSMAVHRTRAALPTIGGVLLAFAGVVLVVATHGDEGPAGGAPGGLVGGTVIIAIAAIGYAVATVIAKIKLRSLDAIGLATSQLSLASLMLLPVALGGERPGALRFGALAAVAVLGFAGSGLAYILYFRLLSQISATQLAAVTYVLPIWGLVWGSFAGESIGLGTCLGVALTIAGLALLNMRGAHARPIEEPTSPPRSSARASANPE